MAQDIILDCDPGHDDALALLLAAGSPEVNLVAVTTVAGNQTVDKTTTNALAVMAAADIQVPIAKGAGVPLVRKPIVAPDIHGESGLDGPVLPAAQVDLDPRHAIDLIIDEVMSRPPGTLTLVATGPMTNVALAMRKEPRIIGRVKEVVIMGGSFTRGNRTPSAEFNIYVDPEAAEAVLAGDWPVVQVTTDLTHQALATSEVRQRIDAIGSPLTDFVGEILKFFGATYKEHQGFDDPPVHDLCCVARVVNPAVFTTVDAFVTVELAGKWTVGETVTDFDNLLGEPVNTSVATELEWDLLWDMTVKALKALSEPGRVNGQVL